MVEVVLFDHDGQVVTQPHVPGELYVRSKNVLSTYHKAHDKYQADMRGDHHTVGDVAYFDEEGFYYICDRKKDMIISGGMNIYPAEIEAALDAHSDVLDVAVIGIPSEEWGEAVHAVVVRRTPSLGAEGLYGYDTDGKLLWRKDLGPLDAAFFVAPDAQWGVASSPVIHAGVVYLQCDVLNDRFLAAFDLETGRELWRTPRRDVPTWSTPAVHEADGRTVIVVNGWKHIGGYDAKTGQEVWKLRGGGDIPVPAPVVAHGLVFITNAHGPGSPIYAVRAGARGDITLAEGKTSSEHVAWSIERGGNYMQTPLVYGEHLYTCRDNGKTPCC